MNKKKRLRILTFLISLSSLFILSCGNPLILQLLDPKTVSFETNGGSNVDSQTVFRDHPVKRPPDPSKDGHTFDAWYIDNDNFDEQWDFNDIPTASFTLYANWYPEGPGTAFITSVAIIVTGPATGETPDPEASGTGNFTVSEVTWTPDHDLFLSDTAYTATVTLTAHQDYSFAATLTSATINGQPATVADNTGGTVTLSHTFALTGKAVIAITVTAQPGKLVYTHGDTLDLSGLAVTLTHDDDTTEDVELGDFVLKNISANPAHGAVLSRSTHNGQPVIVSIGSHSADTDTLTVNKAAGAAVSVPTAETISVDSVTLAPVPAPGNGQTIEYAISNNESAPIDGWQDSRTFSGLTAGTTYYFFARSAANDNYDAGTPSPGTAITTDHSHAWGEWEVTADATETEDGEETRTCLVCGEKDTRFSGEYATGTSGLDFALIEVSNPPAYRVSNTNNDNGRATGDIFIPAFHRENTSSPYLPVTAINLPPAAQGNGAFGGDFVTSVTFAEGSQLTTISGYAFEGCTKLESITIPASVETIGANAFSGCTNLTTVTIPANSNLTSIGVNVFAGCASLASITIPANVTSIGNDAFNQCTSLTTVTIPANSNLTTIGPQAFVYCYALTDINIPASVTSIAQGAFYQCSSLASVTIGAGVETIGANAFYNCTNLTNIIIDNDKVVTYNGTEFDSNINWGTIFTASGLSVTFTKNVTEQAFNSAGDSHSSITSVTIAEGVTTIGQRAFCNCTGLTSINIANSVTTIGEFAFWSTGITSITIPASVESIVGNAFNSCTSLTSVTFAGTIAPSSINANAFDGDLVSVYVNTGPGTYTKTGATWTKDP